MTHKSLKEHQDNMRLIKWHIINSLLAGGLVFAGAIADGSISLPEVLAALGASFIVAIIKFKEFWGNTKPQTSYYVFSFIH